MIFATLASDICILAFAGVHSKAQEALRFGNGVGIWTHGW